MRQQLPQSFGGTSYSSIHFQRDFGAPHHSPGSVSDISTNLIPHSVNFNQGLPLGSNICCTLCREVVADVRSFKSHMSLFHGQEMPFPCTLCGKGYASESGLSLHMQVHEGKTFVCPICDSRFTQNSTMKRHMRTLHKTTQCFTCKGMFKLGMEYEQHVLHCSS